MAVAEGAFEAREDAVVRLVECVELVELPRFGLDFAVVVFRREFAPDLGLGPIGVHVEGAREPFALLGELHPHVAGPGDVRALALVRVLDDRGECRLDAALSVQDPLHFAGGLAVEPLLVVDRSAPLHVVVGVSERQEGARIGLAVVVVGADAVDTARQLRAFLQDDVERAADALAVDVADGLRMISTRSTSSAGMRSTTTVLSLVPPVHAPAIDQDLGVFAADAAQRRLGVLADVALEADTGYALHHVADRERLEALEVLLVVREGRSDRVDAVARIDALGQHFDFRQFRLRRRQSSGRAAIVGRAARLIATVIRGRAASFFIGKDPLDAHV